MSAAENTNRWSLVRERGTGALMALVSCFDPETNETHQPRYPWPPCVARPKSGHHGPLTMIFTPSMPLVGAARRGARHPLLCGSTRCAHAHVRRDRPQAWRSSLANGAVGGYMSAKGLGISRSTKGSRSFRVPFCISLPRAFTAVGQSTGLGLDDLEGGVGMVRSQVG